MLQAGDLDALFAPKSTAVIVASNCKGSVGSMLQRPPGYA